VADAVTGRRNNGSAITIVGYFPAIRDRTPGMRCDSDGDQSTFDFMRTLRSLLVRQDDNQRGRVSERNCLCRNELELGDA
jgi:hypothetical protein